MSITNSRHTVKEIQERRCTIVETKTTQERVDFLTALLEHNGYEVLVEEDKRKSEEDPLTYTLGVTDIIFNPVLAVYQRRLKTPDGRRVTPAYWNQETEETNPNYWAL